VYTRGIILVFAPIRQDKGSTDKGGEGWDRPFANGLILLVYRTDELIEVDDGAYLTDHKNWGELRTAKLWRTVEI
jgi:hypothetical protein